MNYIIVFFIATFGLYKFFTEKEIHRPPGVLVKESPVQKELPVTAKPILYKNQILQPLADYKIKGRLLSAEKYWLDATADISPIDLCLGWNHLSDSTYLEDLTISQNSRFCFYRYNSEFSLNPEEIKVSISNTHIIPANAVIKKQVDRLRIGQVVELSGQLVRVDQRNGQEWMSSLTRDDEGPGACEIMYVTNIRILL
ncbi:MAG: hypothetical protein ACOYOK_03030 [Pseudobdellovibrionaceae bacterium]